MIDLFVVYALLAEANPQDYYPYDMPSIEYYESGHHLKESQERFEAREKTNDEIFFRSDDPNKDRNPFYFPGTTIPKNP